MSEQPNQADQLKEAPVSDISRPSPWAALRLRRRGAGWQVQIFWRNFILWFLAVVACFWLVAASGAYAWVKYSRQVTTVSFADMALLPFRWQKYQQARGDFTIEVAKEDLKKERYREAFFGLRFGLVRSPANMEARILLAQFYAVWRRPDLTRQVLLDGLSFHSDNVDYLKLVFSFLLNAQDDKQVIALKKSIVGDDRTVNPRNQLVALATSTALYFRGNYDDAENILRDYRLDSTRDGRLLAARIAWDRSLHEQAIDMLRVLAVDYPADDEIYAQLVSYLRDDGRNEEARRESFVRALANPENARARIDQLYVFQQGNEREATAKAIDDVLRDFSTKTDALLALGNFAVNTGDPKLALRVYEHCKSHDLPWDSAALMAVEAHVVAGQYSAALNMVRDLQRENPDWNKRYAIVFNGIQAVAHYGLGDAEAAQLFLNNYLSQPNLRADNLVAVSKRLLAVGAKPQARQVLDQAVQADALNQAALSNLIRLDLDINHSAQLATNVRKLLGMRRPSTDLLRDAYRRLGSDAFLFAPERTALLQDIKDQLNKQALTGS